MNIFAEQINELHDAIAFVQTNGHFPNSPLAVITEHETASARLCDGRYISACCFKKDDEDHVVGRYSARECITFARAGNDNVDVVIRRINEYNTTGCLAVDYDKDKSATAAKVAYLNKTIASLEGYNSNRHCEIIKPNKNRNSGNSIFQDTIAKLKEAITYTQVKGYLPEMPFAAVTLHELSVTRLPNGQFLSVSGPRGDLHGSTVFSREECTAFIRKSGLGTEEAIKQINGSVHNTHYGLAAAEDFRTATVDSMVVYLNKTIARMQKYDNEKQGESEC